MDEIELLARMWLACDPNRMPDTADDMGPLYVDGIETMQPRWKWFVPRAEASLAMIRACGYDLVKVKDIIPSEPA